MKSKQKFVMSFLLLAVMSMLSVTTGALAIHENHGGDPFLATTAETEQKPHHAHMRFFEDPTVLSSDWIHWQVTFANIGDLAETQAFLDNDLVALLTIDGNAVELVPSEVYIETEIGLGPAFDLNYLSHPLSVGEHRFESSFFFEGGCEDGCFFSPVITVEPRGRGK